MPLDLSIDLVKWTSCNCTLPTPPPPPWANDVGLEPPQLTDSSSISSLWPSFWLSPSAPVSFRKISPDITTSFANIDCFFAVHTTESSITIAAFYITKYQCPLAEACYFGI